MRDWIFILFVIIIILVLVLVVLVGCFVEVFGILTLFQGGFHLALPFASLKLEGDVGFLLLLAKPSWKKVLQGLVFLDYDVIFLHRPLCMLIFQLS